MQKLLNAVSDDLQWSSLDQYSARFCTVKNCCTLSLLTRNSFMQNRMKYLRKVQISELFLPVWKSFPIMSLPQKGHTKFRAPVVAKTNRSDFDQYVSKGTKMLQSMMLMMMVDEFCFLPVPFSIKRSPSCVCKMNAAPSCMDRRYEQ